MRLSEADQAALQQAALDLHEPRDLDALRQVAPGIFRRVIAIDLFLWLEGGIGPIPDLDPNFVVWDSPHRVRKPHLQKIMAFMKAHPFTGEAVRTGGLGPYRLSDFWSKRQLLESEIYNSAYEAVGIGRLLSIALLRGTRGGTLNMCRPITAPDFTERDRVMLRLLAPHFHLAYRAAEAATARSRTDAEALADMGLTERENDVALWLARGRTNNEIATILGMRPRTVEKHVENIFTKLGVENRTAAAHVILRRGAPGDGSEPAPVPRQHGETMRLLRKLTKRRA